jgi:hypothetical protein
MQSLSRLNKISITIIATATLASPIFTLNAFAKTAVGSCNSTQGCKNLKAACESAKYEYESQADNKGLCYKPTLPGPGLSIQASPQNSNRPQRPSTITSVQDGDRDAHCHDATLCKKLMNRCQGSSFDWIVPGTHGVCKD